ncbi:ergosterol biosynthesis protein [Xanthoria parietina]
MSMLPESSGLLPYWLLVVVAFSVLNTVQCYNSVHFARRTFNGPTAAAEVTPFAGRLFGSWSFLSGLVRLYAAYHINDKHLYFLALSTYCIVLTHFAGELLVYGTLKLGKGLAPPLFVATTSVVWMITQWSFYVD